MSRCRGALAVGVALTVCIPTASAQQDELTRLVGQTIVTGVEGTHPSAALLERIRRGEVGGVIFFRKNLASDRAAKALVAQLQAAASAGGNPPLLVAVDQEGGRVRRLPDVPPEDAPASITSAAQAASEASAAGTLLRRIGINVDLAPVLDTPGPHGNFLGTRAFGSNPARNAALGTARANTDSAHVWITRPKRTLDAGLAPFVAAVGAGVELVMVSNAGYRAYDPSGPPAVLSRAIVTGLRRGRLGFDRVVISDAMSAPGPNTRAHAAVRALTAGTDVLLYTNEAGSEDAFADVVAAARSGELPLATLRAANDRIAALKRRIAPSR